jgi:hypothetical protein
MEKKLIMIDFESEIADHEDIWHNVYLDYYDKYFKLVDDELTDEEFMEIFEKLYHYPDSKCDNKFYNSHGVTMDVDEKDPHDEVVVHVDYGDFYAFHLSDSFPIYEVTELLV